VIKGIIMSFHKNKILVFAKNVIKIVALVTEKVSITVQNVKK